MYLSKGAVAISIAIGFAFLIVYFSVGVACPQTSKQWLNEQNKDNGNGSGNFDRYSFAMFSNNVRFRVQ